MVLFSHRAFMDKINDRGSLSPFEGLSQPLLLLSSPSINYKVSALRS